MPALAREGGLVRGMPGPSWPEKGARLFLTLMVIGLVGLVMMAIPAFGRHGHACPTAGHALGHGAHRHALGSGHVGHARASAHAPASAHASASAPASTQSQTAALGKEMVPADAVSSGL